MYEFRKSLPINSQPSTNTKYYFLAMPGEIAVQLDISFFIT
jgi:hypothetical protein